MIPHWINIARGYIGTHEGAGIKNNPKVMRFFVEAGHPEVHEDSTPWCAAFIGAILKESGLPNTKSLAALSYLTYGQHLGGPAIGAIGVKERVGGGHVFFVVGYDKGFVYALGGNQNDQVCIEKISRRVIKAYRWPPGVPLPEALAQAGEKTGAVGAKES